MKRICTYLYLYIIAAAALVACDDSGKYITEPTLGEVQFGVTAEVPDSRTALTQGEDGIYRAIWKSGDNIRIAQIADSSAVEYSDHILTEDAEKVEIIASFSQSSASQFTYVLASPSVVVNEDFSTLSLTLPAEQTPSALETFDGNADILISDALNLEAQPTGQSIDFDVNRLSAVGKMTVTNLALTDGDKVTSVTFTASQPLAGTIKNIYTSNLLAGKLQTTDFTFTDSSNSVKVNLPQAQSGSFTYFMCCLPTTLSTGEQYTVTVRTEQGRYTKSATIPTPLEFIEGQITSCTINMSGIALDTTPEDETTTYNIGDLVTINGTKGVVFQTTPNIKIVSAEEASLQWGSMGVLGVQTGAISTTDGAYNMSIIKAISDYENNYPAFKWCADLGEDWYLPSYDELFVMDNDLSVVNKTLTDNGFSALASQESVYWSSSEYVDSSNNYAHNVNLSTGVMNIGAKNTTARVRAVLVIGDNPADVDLSLYADLSAEGTANCYLVQVAGNYKFKAVKGNSTESVGAAHSAKVLWETFGTDVTPNVGDLVVDAGYKDDYIYFSTNATFNNGNASIAVYDANGTILWSWHIWCSAEGWEDDVYANNAGTMMDRNLGATSATPGSVGALGLMYQWGRKDPFLSASSISADALAVSTGNWTTNSSKQTVEYACQNPTTFIGDYADWCTGDGSRDSNYDLRWKDTEKTAYDPCPVGYRVPKGGSNGLWKTSETTTSWDWTNHGLNWTLANGTTAWYPAVGYFDSSLFSIGSSGGYWSASPDPSTSSYSLALYFNSDNVYPATYDSRGRGCSVRCVRDIDVVPEPDDPATRQILYTSTDGNVVTPFSSTVFGANIVSNTYDSSLGLGTITFDGEVTQIGVRAFDGCTTLSGITIPQSVTTIGMMAFEETALSSITIPDNVTTIGEYAFRYCSSLKEFKGNYASEDGRCLVLNGVLNSFASAEIDTYIIPNDITAIGDGAFANSTLSSVTLPESITLIGSSAFSVCHNLTSINIPAAVTAIDNWAFFMCDKLAEVNITDLSAWFRIEFGGEVNANPLSYSNSVVLMLNGEKITDNIVIPEDITELKNYALHGYDSFTNVVLHSGITAIGNGTFKECNNLNSITLPASITTIGIDAFYACTALTSVYSTPTTPPTLGERAFQKWGDGDYANLDCKIYVPAASVNAYKTANGWNTYADAIVAEEGSSDENRKIYYTSTDGNVVTPYKTDVFGANIVSNTYENGQGVITFDGKVTQIGSYAFRDCTNLASITIPDSVTEIGSYAFRYCTSLASITIPDSVTKIGNYAFYNCSSITSVTIGNGVTSIGSYAFYKCSSLTNVTIPDSVTYIGPSVFENCSSITSVTIGNSVTVIGVYAFRDCSSLTSVTIGNSVTTIGSSAFDGCSNLKDVYYTGDISAWCKISFKSYHANPLYYGAKLYIDNKEVTEVTIPSDVTEIKDYAFSRCSSLTSVTISDSVTTIGNYAFYSCSGLTSITIPDSVTTIGSYAFSGCSSLTSITIPDGVLEIKSNAFYNCSSLVSVYCKPTTPPILGTKAFNNNAADRKIYVPTASVDTYKTVSDWNDYVDAIVGY